MIYLVDVEDIKIPIPGPLGGEVVPRGVRGTRKKVKLASEGREELEESADACKRASVEHSGEVFFGPSSAIWSEEARSCEDLKTTMP